MKIPESDWKTFKELRDVALQRFSQRALDECEEICRDQSVTPYERLLSLSTSVKRRSKEMDRIFDSLRRSSAVLTLRLIWHHELLSEEELSRFSPELQRFVTEVL